MPIRGRPPKKAPAVTMTPEEATSVGYVEYLRAKLMQLEQAVIDANKAGSWQAMFSGAAKAMECRRELDAEIAKASAPDDAMSDEQLLNIIVNAVASLPPQHLERLEDAIEMRRTGKVVRLAGNA
jgi:hypothetical protein